MCWKFIPLEFLHSEESYFQLFLTLKYYDHSDTFSFDRSQNVQIENIMTVVTLLCLIVNKTFNLKGL